MNLCHGLLIVCEMSIILIVNIYRTENSDVSIAQGKKVYKKILERKI